MKLLVTLLALSVCVLATPQQNIPSREDESDSRPATPERANSLRRNADSERLESASELLDLAVAALGSDPSALTRETLASTLAAKAEFVAQKVIDLCTEVACTTEGDTDDDD